MIHVNHTWLGTHYPNAHFAWMEALEALYVRSTCLCFSLCCRTSRFIHSAVRLVGVGHRQSICGQHALVGRRGSMERRARLSVCAHVGADGSQSEQRALEMAAHVWQHIEHVFTLLHSTSHHALLLTSSCPIPFQPIPALLTPHYDTPYEIPSRPITPNPSRIPSHPFTCQPNPLHVNLSPAP